MPMTKSANRKTAILAVSGNHADLSRLRCLFAGSGWELITAESLADAGQSLQRNMVPVVLCESRLPDGDWKALLLMVNQLAHPPKLIVTSRHADETLWAEALNLGAFDVLADPPRQKDVFHALSSAWRSWKDRQRKRDGAAGCASACAG